MIFPDRKYMCTNLTLSWLILQNNFCRSSDIAVTEQEHMRRKYNSREHSFISCDSKMFSWLMLITKHYPQQTQQIMNYKLIEIKNIYTKKLCMLCNVCESKVNIVLVQNSQLKRAVYVNVAICRLPLMYCYPPYTSVFPRNICLTSSKCDGFLFTSENIVRSHVWGCMTNTENVYRSQLFLWLHFLIELHR